MRTMEEIGFSRILWDKSPEEVRAMKYPDTIIAKSDKEPKSIRTDCQYCRSYDLMRDGRLIHIRLVEIP